MRVPRFLRRRFAAMLAVLILLARVHAVPVFTSELVANLPPVDGPVHNSDPGPGVAMGGFFYFAAPDGQPGAAGRELWRTDGTPAGTRW